MRLHVITLGCPKNRVDTENILGGLKAGLQGLELVDSLHESDVVLINTCSFIQEAVSESIETILEAASQKTENQQIIVTGCLVERYGIQTLKTEMPEVDLFVGFDAHKRLPELLGSRPWQQGAFRLLSTPPWRAYLKISEGCSNKCTYCLIPKIRGNQMCREPASIIKEAEELISCGVKEITLIAQDLTAYKHENVDLVRLLTELASLNGEVWFRLLYLYPSRIDHKLLETVSRHKNICPYFDIPVQHASSRILKRMGRQYSKQELQETIAMIREKVPGSYIRTSVIVGFPGETEQDFFELKSFIKEAGFDHLGCFLYSDEDEAPSSRLGDKVDPVTAKKRHAEIMEMQQHISRQKMRKLVGSTVDVLIEGLSDETDLLLQGRTQFQAPEIDGVVYINEGLAEPGRVTRVQITDSHVYDLVGKVV